MNFIYFMLAAYNIWNNKSAEKTGSECLISRYQKDTVLGILKNNYPFSMGHLVMLHYHIPSLTYLSITRVLHQCGITIKYFSSCLIPEKVISTGRTQLLMFQCSKRSIMRVISGHFRIVIWIYCWKHFKKCMWRILLQRASTTW